MRKIIIFLFCVLTVFGCSQKVEDDRIYKDGTYTTTANGYGGDFKVNTKIKDDRIVDISVDEHNETPSLGGVAIEQMIKNMKEKNDYEVDVISGATKTSQALKIAVKEAINNAKRRKK